MIKDVHFVRSARPGRTTRWYIYAWRGGPRVAIIDGERRPRLDHSVVQAILAAKDADHAPPPGTLLQVIRAWRSLDPMRKSSPEWHALAPGTKRVWGGALDRIEEKWGETPLPLWNDPRMVAKVVAWRDSRADTPRAADIGITVLRALLEFGRLRGMVTRNAADKIPRLYRGGQRAEILWTDEDMARFADAAKRIGRAHIVDGLRLAALTGLRRADLVTLTWDQVGEHAIEKRALKRSAGKRHVMTMPRIPSLDALLEDLRGRYRKPGVETVLVNSYGEAWTVNGFGGSFNLVRDAAGIFHHSDGEVPERKHLHDVRGTFCTRLMTETDLTDAEVAEIMAWSAARISGIRRMYVDSSRRVTALAQRLKRL